MALGSVELQKLGIGVAHHFGGGSYIKETRIPAGSYLEQHAHSHDHLSYLVQGTVTLTVDGLAQMLHAPACIKIDAGKVHGVYAGQDSLWLCIWATDCADPDKVDDHILGAP